MAVDNRSWGSRVVLAVAVGLAAGFLLCGYEFVRSPSTSLFIEAYGAKNLPYAMVSGSVFTILLLYGYGRLLTVAGPRRTLFISTLISACILAVAFLGTQANIRFAALLLYAFREAYIVILVEQYWSFINSTLSEGEARRLNGFICGLGSLGAIAGGYATGYLAKAGSAFYVGTENIVLLAAACLVPAALFTELGYRLGGEPEPTAEEKSEKRSLALKLFVDSSYLRRIALLIVLTQLISTTLDLRFFGLVEEALPVKDARTAFTGTFYGRLNVAAGLLQFVVTPILLSVLSLRVIHLLIPLAHIAAAAALLIHPSLFTGGLAFMTFKALDYSLFRAAKEIFYMPLSFDSRYRAKEVIDAFGYRAAKGLAGGLASVVSTAVKVIPGAGYAWAVIACAGAWLLTVTPLVRQHDEVRKTGQ